MKNPTLGNKKSKPGPADLEAKERLQKLWRATQDDRDARGLTPLTQQQVVDLFQEQTGKGSQGLVSQYMNGSIALNYRAVMIFAAVIGCDAREIRSDLPEFGMAPVSKTQGVQRGTLDRSPTDGETPVSIPATPTTIDGLLTAMKVKIAAAPVDVQTAIADLVSRYVLDHGEGTHIANAIKALLDEKP